MSLLWLKPMTLGSNTACWIETLAFSSENPWVFSEGSQSLLRHLNWTQQRVFYEPSVWAEQQCCASPTSFSRSPFFVNTDLLFFLSGNGSNWRAYPGLGSAKGWYTSHECKGFRTPPSWSAPLQTQVIKATPSKHSLLASWKFCLNRTIYGTRWTVFQNWFIFTDAKIKDTPALRRPAQWGLR